MLDYKRYGRKKDNIATDIINIMVDCTLFAMSIMFIIIGILFLVRLINIF